MTETTPPPQVWPSLRAIDAPALIEFLIEAFGFVQTAFFGEGDRVDHAQLAWPLGGGLIIGSVRTDENDPWPLPPGGFGAYVVVESREAVEELFLRATAAGAEVLRKPHDSGFAGSRDFAVRDPQGNRWAFGTYRGEPVPKA